MPNIEKLIDSISQRKTDYKTEPADEIYFSIIDFKCAYNQLDLHLDADKRSNFNIVSGDMTGTYRFKTGFYGPTDMPAEFHKAMDYTLIGLKCTYCFPDNILFLRKCSEEDHFHFVSDCLKKLDADNLRINLPKCHFAKQEVSWLGCNVIQSVTSPLDSETLAILSLQPQITPKRLRSFLGLNHFFSNFISNQA